MDGQARLQSAMMKSWGRRSGNQVVGIQTIADIFGFEGDARPQSLSSIFIVLIKEPWMTAAHARSNAPTP